MGIRHPSSRLGFWRLGQEKHQCWKANFDKKNTPRKCLEVRTMTMISGGLGQRDTNNPIPVSASFWGRRKETHHGRSLALRLIVLVHFDSRMVVNTCSSLVASSVGNSTTRTWPWKCPLDKSTSSNICYMGSSPFEGPPPLPQTWHMWDATWKLSFLLKDQPVRCQEAVWERAYQSFECWPLEWSNPKKSPVRNGTQGVRNIP